MRGDLAQFDEPTGFEGRLTFLTREFDRVSLENELKKKKDELKKIPKAEKYKRNWKDIEINEIDERLKAVDDKSFDLENTIKDEEARSKFFTQKQQWCDTMDTLFSAKKRKRRIQFRVYSPLNDVQFDLVRTKNW